MIKQEEIPPCKIALFPDQGSSERINGWVFIRGAGLTLLSCTSSSCAVLLPVYTTAQPVLRPTAPPASILNTKLLKLTGTLMPRGETPCQPSPGWRGGRGTGIQQKRCEIHLQEGRLVLIAPEIDRSTNRSIFNKLPGEGECNIQRLIKQVSVLFKEVGVEVALTKEPVQGQFGQGRELPN